MSKQTNKLKQADKNETRYKKGKKQKHVGAKNNNKPGPNK